MYDDIMENKTLGSVLHYSIMEDLCDDDMMSTCELNRLEPISNRITNIFFLLHSFIHIPTIYVCLLFCTLSLPGTIVEMIQPLITQLEV